LIVFDFSIEEELRPENILKHLRMEMNEKIESIKVDFYAFAL